MLGRQRRQFILQALASHRVKVRPRLFRLLFTSGTNSGVLTMTIDRLTHL